MDERSVLEHALREWEKETQGGLHAEVKFLFTLLTREKGAEDFEKQ